MTVRQTQHVAAANWACACCHHVCPCKMQLGLSSRRERGHLLRCKGRIPLQPNCMFEAGCIQWGDSEMYQIGNVFWERRAHIIASMIPSGATVLDLGCGPNMNLHKAKHPNHQWHYIPADVKQWTPQTIKCDLAADVWPVQSGVTVVACLGVMEYVPDYQLFFHRIRHYNATVFMSYQLVPFSFNSRELNSHEPSR